jgi:hypothetical protein
MLVCFPAVECPTAADANEHALSPSTVQMRCAEQYYELFPEDRWGTLNEAPLSKLDENVKSQGLSIVLYEVCLYTANDTINVGTSDAHVLRMTAMKCSQLSSSPMYCCSYVTCHTRWLVALTMRRVTWLMTSDGYFNTMKYATPPGSRLLLYR